MYFSTISYFLLYQQGNQKSSSFHKKLLRFVYRKYNFLCVLTKMSFYWNGRRKCQKTDWQNRNDYDIINSEKHQARLTEFGISRRWRWCKRAFKMIYNEMVRIHWFCIYYIKKEEPRLFAAVLRRFLLKIHPTEDRFRFSWWFLLSLFPLWWFPLSLPRWSLQSLLLLSS